MKADVSLDNLRHQSVHCATASRNVVQDIGAVGFLIECPFNGLKLASNSSYAIEQFLFLFCRVSHEKPGSNLDKHTPVGILWSRVGILHPTDSKRKEAHSCLTAVIVCSGAKKYPVPNQWSLRLRTSFPGRSFLSACKITLGKD